MAILSMSRKLQFLALTLSLVLQPVLVNHAVADRIKDLTSVAGARSNQLIGYGLVVGLQGTGDEDKISFTAQSLKKVLDRLGVDVDGPISNYDLFNRGVANLAYDKTKLDNVASVLVTATLPPFAKPGQTVDVNVATIGLATSLRGGNLVLTELRGADGEIYALAQGPLTTTGIEVNAAGTEINIGVPTTARVPSGAIVERAVDTPFGDSEYIVLNTNQTDFTTVSAISDAINDKFGVGTANALDARSVAVRAPLGLPERVGFLSMIENIDVIPGEPKARVVVNSRTGTVVISRTVKVTAAAVTQGSLSVSISATNEVVQPEAGLFGGAGEAVEVQNADIEVVEEANPMFLFQPGVDLRDIVEAVNEVGASPSSLIAILEALKSSGSLRAELLVI
jgi:flagellar P-ring protein precursor FlgI